MRNYRHEVFESIFGPLLNFLEMHDISRFWLILLLCVIVFKWVYKDYKKMFSGKIQLGILLYVILGCLFMAVDQQFFLGRLFNNAHEIVRKQPYMASIISVISAVVCVIFLRVFNKRIGGNVINGYHKNRNYYVVDSNNHKKLVSKLVWYSNCLFTMFTIVMVITACMSIVLLLFVKFIIP